MNQKDGKKKGRKIDMTTIAMLIFVVVLAFFAYRKGPGIPLQGLKEGGKLFLDIMPVMIIAFIAAGMIGQILPRELMTRWLGEESGLRGLVIATIAGAVTPGGPFVQFPIVAALFKSGAGIAPLMAYVTSWSLLGINRFLVWEVPLLGWRLAVSRLAVSLVFPIAIGLITRFVYVRLGPV
ncbi:MAG: permease [Deltaproteobacteria bacterium]|nr:permease [Deltaproteobacteria bacterium]